MCSSLCKESQFCVYKLSTYPFHTQWSCMHCKIIYLHAAWKSDVLQYNFHSAWTEMIRRKMRVWLVRSKGNVWLSTSSNFASISPLSGVFNLLCNGKGKQASVKVLVLVLDLPFPQFWIYYIMPALSIDNKIKPFYGFFCAHKLTDFIKMKHFVHK